MILHVYLKYVERERERERMRKETMPTHPSVLCKSELWVQAHTW
jgi:hypothetical protein